MVPVSVIDLLQTKYCQTISKQVYPPTGIAVNPNNNLVYVTNPNIVNIDV